MLKRLAREQETQRAMDADERLATSLHNPLAKLSRNASFRLRTGGSFVMSAAYLVPRDGIDRFTDEIQCLADDRPQLHLLCTGPWPPYSFTPQFKTGEDADG
jgi:glycosyltransferase involved in cell wall biosynthesis